MKICIIGAGYVGLITGTVLAYKNNMHQFTILDVDQSKINSLRNKQHYILEDGFAELFNQLPIRLTANYSDVADSDIFFISVNTPERNGKCNMDYFNSALENVKSVASKNAIIVVKSTVPVGTTASIAANCEQEVYNIPEFLAEGTAIHDMLEPIRILIGTTTKTINISRLISLFNYVTNAAIYVTDSNTSELSKLASNFMLAQRVASINCIETIAKQYNADIMDISRILRMDKRIGNYFLSPSAAFGGSCFRKDISNLSSICSDNEISRYISSVNDINQHHAKLLAQSITGPKVLFLGYGFKNNTEDTRESPTEMVIGFLDKSIQYQIYDAHIKQYSQLPTGQFDQYVLMNDETEYIKLLIDIDHAKIINPRYHILP